MTWQNVLAAGAGGFVGAAARYGAGLLPVWSKGAFPLSTLCINLVGAVLIGAVVRLSQQFPTLSPALVLFLKVGVCGGFTTFSTFSLEGLTLLEEGRIWLFALYALLSVGLCLGGVALGRQLPF